MAVYIASLYAQRHTGSSEKEEPYHNAAIITATYTEEAEITALKEVKNSRPPEEGWQDHDISVKELTRGELEELAAQANPADPDASS